MSGLHAVQLYNLRVPGNGMPMPAVLDPRHHGVSFRVTMAAIDPTAGSEPDATANGAPKFIGSTLRMMRVADDSEDESDEDEDDEGLAGLLDEDIEMGGLLEGEDSEEEEEEWESEDEDPGPSDPSKSPKAKRAAALAGARDDLNDALLAKALRNAIDKGKGKGKMSDLDFDSDNDSEGLDSSDGVEEFVLCTLDPAKSYQQALDFTVSEHEQVYFTATGTHDIYLTGNFLIPEDYDDSGMFDSSDEEEDEDEEYDLEPDDDELIDYDEEDESDELDNVRITEADSDEEETEPPKLVKAEPVVTKGKNKRAHEDSEVDTPEKPTIDSTLKNSLKPATAGAETDESKLSKSQLKKLRKKMKDNAGNAVEPIVKADEDKGVKEEKETTPNKKVQFAKTLVQGPTGTTKVNGEAAKPKGDAKEAKGADSAPKANGVSKGPRVVQGVTIDDRKTGSGPAAKKGDKVSMRYIGKLEKDKKVFDANKKGPPFTFKLGAGDVIKGWDIGVLGMTVGSERRITVPAHLAYGSKGMPGIPANSTLVFDVKCLEIK